MGSPNPASDKIQYRVALLSPGSSKLLVAKDCGGKCLPSVSIPRWSRRARELRKALTATFGIDALILDILSVPGSATPLAIAELLSPETGRFLKPADLSALPPAAMCEEERERTRRILNGEVEDPFSRVGWMREGIAWLENDTGSRFSPPGRLDQYHAGRGFVLVRFAMDNGSAFWLKATGEPNTQEFALTSVLSELCGEYLPALVARRPSWNAWITAEEATGLEALPTRPIDLLLFLETAAGSLAALQVRTAGRADQLLKAGAFDQRPASLCSGAVALFSFLEEAMMEEGSTGAPLIEAGRLRELRQICEESFGCLDALGIPATVVHGDLNPGNILVGASHCQFIDWAETYVGNPLVTFQHLLLLNHAGDQTARRNIDRALRWRYRTHLRAICGEEQIDQAFVFMPLVAAFSTLYGRGNWFTTPLCHDLHRKSCACTLARYMDEAAREPQLLAALRGRPSFRAHHHQVLSPS